MPGAGSRISCPGSRDAATPRMRCRCADTARAAGATCCSSTGPRRLRGRRRARLREAAVAAGARRPFDGRGGRRAAGRDAPGSRRGAARAGAADGPAAGRREARRRASRLSVPDEPARSGRAYRTTCSTRCGRSISARSHRPRDRCAKPRSTSTPSRRACCSTCRCACTGGCPRASRRRCSCWAPHGDRICRPGRRASRPRAITASRRRSLPGLAHMLMLEPGWEAAARALHALDARSSCAAVSAGSSWRTCRRALRPPSAGPELEPSAIERPAVACARTRRTRRAGSGLLDPDSPGSSGSRARRGTRAARAFPRLRRRPSARGRARGR